MSQLTGFGKRLKQSIKQSHYTQKKISEILGINQDTLTNYIKEKTYPKIDFLIKLSQLTSTQLNWLITGTKIKLTDRNTYLADTPTKDEVRIIKLLRKLDAIERAKIEGMIEIKIYEKESKKMETSSTYVKERVTTKELA